MNLIISKPQIVQDLAAEIVSPTELKNWMQIDFNEQDDEVYQVCKSARTLLEQYTGKSFGSKIMKAEIDVDEDYVRLPYGPLQSVVSIVLHVGFGNNETLVAGTDYEVVGTRLRVLREGFMTITYNVGMVELPEDLRADILRLGAWMFQNRGIQFETGDEIKKYPDWAALAANRYIDHVI